MFAGIIYGLMIGFWLGTFIGACSLFHWLGGSKYDFWHTPLNQLRIVKVEKDEESTDG